MILKCRLLAIIKRLTLYSTLYVYFNCSQSLIMSSLHCIIFVDVQYRTHERYHMGTTLLLLLFTNFLFLFSLICICLLCCSLWSTVTFCHTKNTFVEFSIWTQTLFTFMKAGFSQSKTFSRSLWSPEYRPHLVRKQLIIRLFHSFSSSKNVGDVLKNT